MDWKTYEEVVKKIYEALGKDNGVTVECWGNTCKVIGVSTVSHQIDVLTTHSDGLHKYKTAIECKYWNETINKDIIMKVQEIVKDANLNKGIIVSKLGFTPDAITYAKHYNIGLVELRELKEEDWKDRIKKLTIDLEFIVPQIDLMNFITDMERPDLQSTRGIVSAYNINVPGEDITNLEKFAGSFLQMLGEKEKGTTYAHLFTFPKGTFAKNVHENTEISITGVEFKGTLTLYKKTIEINGREHIWLVMKSIFEDKHFVISKDGVITEMN